MENAIESHNHICLATLDAVSDTPTQQPIQSSKSLRQTMPLASFSLVSAPCVALPTHALYRYRWRRLFPKIRRTGLLCFDISTLCHCVQCSCVQCVDREEKRGEIIIINAGATHQRQRQLNDNDQNRKPPHKTPKSRQTRPVDQSIRSVRHRTLRRRVPFCLSAPLVSTFVSSPNIRFFSLRVRNNCCWKLNTHTFKYILRVVYEWCSLDRKEEEFVQILSLAKSPFLVRCVSLALCASFVRVRKCACVYLEYTTQIYSSVCPALLLSLSQSVCQCVRESPRVQSSLRVRTRSLSSLYAPESPPRRITLQFLLNPQPTTKTYKKW